MTKLATALPHAPSGIIVRSFGLMLATAAVLTAIPRTALAEEVQTLPQTIQQGIALLEEKKYEAFLRRFPVPEQLAKMLEHRSLEELARSFSKRHAERLLGMFRQIESQKPEFSQEGQRAEYAVEWENFSRDKLVFEQIDGRWHLRN